MKKLGTNVMIFIVAILFSVVLFYFTENPSFFSASILSLQDAQTMKANAWDIWYKNENSILDVFVSDDLKNIQKLSLTIFYDKDDVSFNFQEIDSQVDYQKISDNQDWILILDFSNFSSNYNYNNSLFELPFISTQAWVVLSEWVVSFANWKNKSLSIWLLNQHSDDYHYFYKEVD